MGESEQSAGRSTRNVGITVTVSSSVGGTALPLTTLIEQATVAVDPPVPMASPAAKSAEKLLVSSTSTAASGFSVGARVGVSVGLSVGVSVGVSVGMSVGVSVGVAVNISVGVSVGVGDSSAIAERTIGTIAPCTNIKRNTVHKTTNDLDRLPILKPRNLKDFFCGSGCI